MKRVGLALAAAAGVVLLGLGLTSIDRDLPPNPARVSRPVAGIYRSAVGAVRAPVVGGLSEALQSGLVGFLEVLPLDPAVRARLEARVHSDAAVDELVPFVLFTKSLYDHHRSPSPGFGPAAGPKTDAGGGVGLPSPEVLAELLTLYDAVWLKGAPAGAPLEQTLRCGDQADLRARADAATPVVEALLADFALDGEAGAALDHVRSDKALLRTVATSLVELVDAEVCKHYAVFARRAARRAELRAFLERGLTSGDPAVWDWLARADERPLAVHVIVDGLQGGLTSALVRGDAAWFGQALAAHDVPRPSQRSTRAGPPMALDVLRGYAAGLPVPKLEALGRIYAGTGAARSGLSTTPTISVRNLPLAMTGAPVAGPGGTGIPNFHFVDRSYVDASTGGRGRPYYFYGNDALQLTRLTHESGMRTMFERLEDLDTMSCGSQYDERAGYSFDAFLNLAVGEKVRDFGETLCADELDRRAATERRLRTLRASLEAYRPVLQPRHHPWELYDLAVQATARAEALAIAAELAESSVDGLPDYLQWYDPWPDHFAHALGPYADGIIGPTGEYARLDHWLGRVQAAYGDVADRTLFGIAGDHGLTPVLWVVSPEQEVFEALRDEGVALIVRKISSDEGEGPKWTDRFDPPPMTGIDAVVASTAGGNYMIDVFADQGARWGDQPLAADLRRWRTLGGRELDLLDQVSRRLGGSLDYAAVRVTPCDPAACTVALLRHRGGVAQQMTIDRRGDRITVTGDDLLGVDLSCAAGCTEADWTERTADSPRPDAVVQLAHLYDTDRAGTINLFPVAGVGYNTVVPGRHAGESFAEKDALVALWGTPVQRAERPHHATNGQVAPTLYAWLTGETPRAGVEGWGFDPLAWR